MTASTSSPQAALKNNAPKAHRAADLIKALGHPIRLRIIALLCERAEHVSGLSSELDIKQSIISQQLRILRMNGLVQVEKTQGFAYYSLARPHLRQLVRCVESCLSQ